MNPRLAAEMGAAPRVFSSAGAVLFFYVEQYARRTGIVVPVEWCGLPLPRLHREQREATYAHIVACLHEREPEDYSFDPLITERRLEALVHWYLTDEPASASHRMIAHFSDDLGLRSATWPAFQRECRRTRNVLRRRFEGRGLVTEEV